MEMISGFTFIHNAIDSGYPIVEAIRAVQPYVDEIVIVDMQSTDNTKDILEQLADIDHKNKLEYTYNKGKYYKHYNIKIIDGYWGNEAGETLRQAHNQYRQCSGDVIIHFEADEVYDDRLIKYIVELIKYDHTDISVHRLQLEQNFQRCRWYPEPVHRVFPRLSHTRKEGHTTDRHPQAMNDLRAGGWLSMGYY
jgi:glycosyltransferase involved in cell wall biosynthesis